MQMYGRRDRESTRTFLWVSTIMGASITIFSTVFLVADLRGGDATATVVRVRSQEVYTVSFATRDGTRCEKSREWSPRPEEVDVYDTFKVHYSSLSSCYNFQRADESYRWAYAMFQVPLTIGVVGLLATRGRRFRRDRDGWFGVRHF